MGERKVKGSVPGSHLRFIKKKWGAMGLQSALKHAGIASIPKDGEWVPISVNESILGWIALNRGEDMVIEAGRYTGKDLGVFKYLFASLSGLESLLKRSATNYGFLFNFGGMSVDETEDGYEVTVRDGRVSPYSCLAWRGAIESLMEITRSKGVLESMESPSSDCKFLIRV